MFSVQFEPELAVAEFVNESFPYIPKLRQDDRSRSVVLNSGPIREIADPVFKPGGTRWKLEILFVMAGTLCFVAILRVLKVERGSAYSYYHGGMRRHSIDLFML